MNTTAHDARQEAIDLASQEMICTAGIAAHLLRMSQSEDIEANDLLWSELQSMMFSLEKTSDHLRTIHQHLEVSAI